jgi:transcriptional regulator with XRE-family HTH domain
VIRLTHERQLRGWSKAFLARAAALDQTLVSKAESGRLRLYERELRRLAHALGLPAEQANCLLDEVTP